jgi:hypothetical protein
VGEVVDSGLRKTTDNITLAGRLVKELMRSKEP